MHEDLERRFDRIEEQKADLIARVAARSVAEQIRAPRRGGGWSPRALLHHLVLAEEQTLLHVAAAGAGPERVPASRRPLVALLAGVMRAGVPLPAPPQMTPPDEANDLLPPDAAVARWDAARRTLRERLEAVPPDDIRNSAPLARHPIFGPLDAGQVLDLLEAHLVYHARQAARWGRGGGEGAGEKPAR
jgi:hypothetical protein